METTTTENVIFFKDLVFSALRRWRAMIVAALIVGLALGCYKGITELKATPQSSETDSAQIQYKALLQTYNSSYAKQKMLVDKLQAKLEEQLNYVDNSLLMSLDPYNYYEAQLILYISTNYQIQPALSYQNPDETPNVLAAYSTMLSAPRIKDALAATAGVESKYFDELYSVTVDTQSNQVAVTIIHADESTATALQTQLVALSEDIRQEISNTVYIHEATPLESTVRLMTTGTLAETQSQALTYISALRTEIATAEAVLGTFVPPAAPASRSFLVVDIILFTVIGCMLGVFLIAFWSCVVRLTSQAVYSTKALVSRTGIKVLGAMAQKKNRNKIDCWINRLEGRQLDIPERRRAFLAQDVAMRCTQNDTLLVCGCGNAQVQKTFADELQKVLPQKKVLCCGSILNDEAAVIALANADTVLLVEQCESSSYPGVAEECRKIADYGKQLLGCILVDG